MTLLSRKVLALSLGGLTACSTAHSSDSLPVRASFEVDDATQNAFSLPMPGLSERERASFFVGNSFFNQNWLSAPSSIETRDGLGPLFNARSCSGCHFKDGRGRPPGAGEPMRTMLLRISLPGGGPYGAPKPEPGYGDQLQGAALTGVSKEADVFVRYREQAGVFADGDAYSLREPEIVIEQLGYGPLAEGTQRSARVAPALIGLGLLEAVQERELLARADPDDRDHDGISGRPNRVFSVAAQREQLGRFGWKAEQPTLIEQTAAAFIGDMGITSALFPHENHGELEADCQGRASGGSPELTQSVLASVVSYVRTLAVPARRAPEGAEVQRGARLFERAGCASCHVASLTTAADVQPSELAQRTIHPYTDLLLHDLGDGLSDQRPSFAARGNEWRTAPLWGLGLVEHVNGHAYFLHDGRARDLQEAVLWHGGEAAAAQQAFVHMQRSDRHALVRFLESL